MVWIETAAILISEVPTDDFQVVYHGLRVQFSEIINERFVAFSANLQRHSNSSGSTSLVACAVVVAVTIHAYTLPQKSHSKPEDRVAYTAYSAL